MKVKISKLTVLLILIVVSLVSSNLNWGKDNWKGVMKADGKGYYAYLPAVFIYNDLNFGFFDEIEKEKYYNPDLYYDYRSNSNGKIIDKYYCGTAILQTPFFLTAHSLSYLFGFEMDGYSKLYALFVHFSALFYFALGLIFLRKTLRSYKVDDWLVAFVLCVAVFGTNLFFYTVSEPSMSHVFSFGLVSMFVYFSRNYFVHRKKNTVIILAILLGLIVLVRPVNGLVIFILPFLAASFNEFKVGVNALVKNWIKLLLAIMLFITICFIQLIIYKISTDSYVVYGYAEEGFNFLSPHFIDILFSYKKGLFLYTPVFFLCIVSSFVFLRKSKYQLFTFLAFFLLITYVFSSWWMWYYGGSFSSRVYVEYIPIFMIPLAISLQTIKLKWFKKACFSVLIGLVMVCQIQTFQYRYYQIHWEDMTKEMYWDVFLSVDNL